MLYDAFTRLSGLLSHYVMNLARDTELNENIIFDDVRRYLLYISTCMHLHTSMCVCVDVTLLSSVNWLVYLPVSVVGFLSTFHLIVCSRFIAFSLYTRAKSTSFEIMGLIISETFKQCYFSINGKNNKVKCTWRNLSLQAIKHQTFNQKMILVSESLAIQPKIMIWCGSVDSAEPPNVRMYSRRRWSE